MTMADGDLREPLREPRRTPAERARLARLRERVLSGFAPEDDDLAAIVGPLAGVLVGEVFAVSDLRRIGSPLVHVEPGFEALTGYDPATAVGRDLGFLLRNDTEQEAVHEARAAVRDGRPVTVTVRNYRADGALFWCEQRHHPVRDARGRVGHLVTVLRDVTDAVHARSAEDVVREGGPSRGPYLAYGALIDASGAFRVSWVGGDPIAVLGLDGETLRREGWAGCVHPDDREGFEARASVLRRDGGSRRDRYRVRVGERERLLEDVATVAWAAPEAGLVAVHGVVRESLDVAPSVRRALAGVDPGSGLPTEEVLADRLALAARRAPRHGRLVAYVALSLDHFDFVQTHMDAQRGERIVREAARRVRRVLRRGDTLARVGPGDFALLLDDLPDADAALPVMEKVLAWIARPFDDGRLRLELSASAGVATAAGPVRFDAVRAEAAAALARVREAGGGDVAFADEERERRLRATRAFDSELRGAFAQEQWVLHYQPRVRLVGGEVTGEEALVRWRHPQRGLLLPAEFLVALQSARLGGELFEQVLPQALRRVRQRLDAGRPRRVSVNVGLDDLERDDLMPFVQRSLQRAGVAPAALELELHPTSDPSAFERVGDRLSALRRLGVRLALDDFGVIDTNLARLRDLPIDVLKIDRSFVQRIGGQGSAGDPADLEMLRAMVSLGRGLGLTVVAEGIETDGQRRRLRAIACDEGQGYLFAPPTPDGELVAPEDDLDDGSSAAA